MKTDFALLTGRRMAPRVWGAALPQSLVAAPTTSLPHWAPMERGVPSVTSQSTGAAPMGSLTQKVSTTQAVDAGNKM